MKKREELVKELLSNPEKILEKKPFTRGAKREGMSLEEGKVADISEKVRVKAPRFRQFVVRQEQFLRELDPNCHDVIDDDNIPSICVKVHNDDYREIKYNRMALPIQQLIKNKQVMHLSALPMQFTLLDKNPSESQRENFITFKQYWDLRNQDGMKRKFVDAQKSVGDAGLLYYFDEDGCIKSRIISFMDGYVLCPHNDANGDRVLEAVYYSDDNNEIIDAYDKTNLYRIVRNFESENSDWQVVLSEPHGFSEIPLITKRGEVAWNKVQPIIESYEVLYNVFNAIQKRFGWGIFYVKGKFKEQARKIAGSVILNDTSLDNNGDAKFLTPPTPQGTIDTLNLMLESIQLGSSTTFLLPKDVKMSGDISGIAIMLTQSLDLENAMQGVIEWQNVADKMVRLFKEGLSKELVSKGIHATAYTEFKNLNIAGAFKVWRPLNEYEFNQMVASLSGAGLLSKETGVELNTLSKPDEMIRIEKEAERALALQVQQVEVQNETTNNLEEDGADE